MKSGRQCHKCGKPDHIAKFCNENYNEDVRTCYICHRRGHSARQCDKDRHQSIQCFRCQRSGHIARNCPVMAAPHRQTNAKNSAETYQSFLPSTTVRQNVQIDKRTVTESKKNMVKKSNRITKLETLANELLLDIFEYLSVAHLLCAFHNLNARFQMLLFAHSSTGHLDFQYISKKDLSIVSRQYLPLISNQIMSLRLSDSNLKLKQTDILLSFDLNLHRFNNLRSLSLCNVHSEQVMNKMMMEWVRLPNLTHLKLIKCHSSFGRTNTNCLSNTVWSLPKLTHYYLDTGRYVFCIPTMTSSSLEYVSIQGYSCRLNEVSRLLEKTPHLRGLCIRHEDLNDDQYLSSPISSITLLKLYSLHSRSVMMNLLQKMVNICYLSVETFYINLDGYQWEQIIGHHLKKLRIFRLKMDIQLTGIMNKEKQVDILLDSFRSSFWLEERKWFVRCHRQPLENYSNILLFTMPLIFRDYNATIMRFPYKSTEQPMNNTS